MVALFTSEQAANDLAAAISGHHPGPVAPWWVVAHMLVVTTLEPGHPVLFFILMEADDLALHQCFRPWGLLAGAAKVAVRFAPVPDQGMPNQVRWMPRYSCSAEPKTDHPDCQRELP